MTSVNVSQRMHELSDGVIRPFNATTAGRKRSILGIPVKFSGPKEALLVDQFTADIIDYVDPTDGVLIASHQGIKASRELRGDRAETTVTSVTLRERGRP